MIAYLLTVAAACGIYAVTTANPAHQAAGAIACTVLIVLAMYEERQ